MPDSVCSVELSRGKGLNVVHMYVINAEAFPWSYVKTSAHTVHNERTINLTALRESFFYFFTEFLVLTL